MSVSSQLQAVTPGAWEIGRGSHTELARGSLAGSKRGRCQLCLHLPFPPEPWQVVTFSRAMSATVPLSSSQCGMACKARTDSRTPVPLLEPPRLCSSTGTGTCTPMGGKQHCVSLGPFLPPTRQNRAARFLTAPPVCNHRHGLVYSALINAITGIYIINIFIFPEMDRFFPSKGFFFS